MLGRCSPGVSALSNGGGFGSIGATLSFRQIEHVNFSASAHMGSSLLSPLACGVLGLGFDVCSCMRRILLETLDPDGFWRIGGLLRYEMGLANLEPCVLFRTAHNLSPRGERKLREKQMVGRRRGGMGVRSCLTKVSWRTHSWACNMHLDSRFAFFILLYYTVTR